MTGTVSLCVVLEIVGNSGLVHHREPLSERAELKLSADRASYYVKEPITLTLTFRSLSTTPVKGHFALEPSMGFAEIWYRRADQPFSRFQYPSRPDVVIAGGLVRRNIREYVVSPKEMKPGEEIVHTAILAFDAAASRFPLSEPGRYEFKVVYQDVPKEATAVVDSNVIVIDAQPAPASQGEAADEYSAELAQLTQFAPTHLHNAEDAQSIAHAARFLERHPDSVYAEPLREGAKGTLHRKIGGKQASSDEVALYDKLRGGSAGQPAWAGAAVDYKVGDLVMHDGETWKCIQAHTSQSGWPPSTTPALWSRR
jgi:hypothetical protein